MFVELNIDILLHMDLLHILENFINIWLIDWLIDLMMHLFFLIQNFLLLIFRRDDVEYMATCFIFISIIIIINHFIFTYSSTSVLHTFSTLAPYGYDVILSKLAVSYHHCCPAQSCWLVQYTHLLWLNVISLFSKQSL